MKFGIKKEYLSKGAAILLVSGIYIALFLILSLIFYSINLPFEKCKLAFYVVFALFCALASFVSGVFSQKMGWLHGLLGGLAFIAIALLFSLILTGGIADFTPHLIKLPISLITCVLCGAAGINLKQKH